MPEHADPHRTRMTQAACSDCRFFVHQERGSGTCHRYPPGYAGDASPRESHHWRFPVVNCHAWCGEFVWADGGTASSTVTAS
jgi:hypothetical protein